MKTLVPCYAEAFGEGEEVQKAFTEQVLKTGKSRGRVLHTRLEHLIDFFCVSHTFCTFFDVLLFLKIKLF